MTKIEKVKEALRKALFEVQEDKAEGPAENKKYTDAELKISAMEIGGKVEMIDAEGNIQPAGDGEYEMESGDKFTVVDGMIAELNGEKAEEKPEEEVPVEAAEEEKEEEKEEAPAEEAPVEEVKEEEPKEDEKQMQIDMLKGELEAMKAAVEELKALIAGSVSKDEMNQFSSEVLGNLKKLASIPAEFSRTTNSNVIKDSMEEKLLDLARIHGSIKK